jgi:phospholipid/cholesterol/gamma-HCH transport system permease protein
MNGHWANRLAGAIGGSVLGTVRYMGGLALLLAAAARCMPRTLFGKHGRSGRSALAFQCVRVGVRGVGIICLVQLFIGITLALQMARPLEYPYRQSATIANIIGIAGFRMLGPILAGVVLSGFAGASIAAELGTMVVAEEIEALEATALNPIRFLVVPRMLATVAMLVLLTIISDWMIALGGYLASWATLEPKVYLGYWDRMHDQLAQRGFSDFTSGLILAAVFGVLISSIACYEGLKVKGGAESVGRATTMTVVNSIVGIIFAACVFTMIFYAYKF